MKCQWFIAKEGLLVHSYSSLVSSHLLFKNNETWSNPLGQTVMLLRTTVLPWAVGIRSDHMPCLGQWSVGPGAVLVQNKGLRVSSLFPFSSSFSLWETVMFPRPSTCCRSQSEDMCRPFTTGTRFGWDMSLCFWRFHQLQTLYLHEYISSLIHTATFDNWKNPSFNDIRNAIIKKVA